MVNSGSPPSKANRPAAMRTSPTTRRRRDDFPAPLRPRMVKATPDATEKFTPAKTFRPRRREARSEAESCIGRVIARVLDEGRGAHWPVQQPSHSRHVIDHF